MNLVLTGGGSAGHVVPHLALLSSLEQYFTNICYIGSGGIEKNIIANTKLKFYQINPPKLIRAFNFKNCTIPFKLIKSIRSSKKILLQIKPDVVFSKGGYVALPVVIAAKMLKIPIIAHESDLSIGLANKLSSKFASFVYTSFYESSLELANGMYSGPPIRDNLFNVNVAACKKKYDFKNKKQTVIIIGGGSGSKAINACIRQNIDLFLEHFNILHICGKNNLSNIDKQGYKEFEFVDDIDCAYGASDIVVSRAGSNTVFEIVLLRKPSVLIPLPKNVSRGDQIENAKYFEERGLCKVLEQENLTAQRLLFLLKSVKNDSVLKKELSIGKIKSGNSVLVAAIVNAASNKNS